MNYFKLFVSHWNILGFGLLFAFFSGLGQTYFVSLFIPNILKEFSMTSSAFASLYSLATLISAACLPFLGRQIDHLPLKRYSFFVTIGLLTACLLLFFSGNAFMLFLGLFAIRLSAQGLMSHTSTTSVARDFHETRGKALGIVGLGYPLSEMVFPVLIAFMLPLLGWRVTWPVLGAAGCLVLWLYLYRALPASGVPPSSNNSDDAAPSSFVLWKDGKFYLLLPSVIALPCILTGSFLFQTLYAESRGWQLEWVAYGITGFALSRVLMSLVVGVWIDKVGATKLFPYFLIPLIMGFFCLINITQPWVLPLYLFLAGVSMGAGGSIKAAFLAEIYGVAKYGTMKSQLTTLMVFSTALSPVLIGKLIDAGYSFSQIMVLAVVFLFFALILSFFAIRLYRKPSGPAVVS